MSLLNYVKKEEATGAIAEIYKNIEENLNVLPNVLQFHTASPELFPKFLNVIMHFTENPNLSRELIAYVRLLISDKIDCEYCVRFNTSILNFLGVSDDDVELAKHDYHNTKLPEKDKAILIFLIDMVFDKLEDKQARIEELREIGWSDKDIYEAGFLAGLQRGMNVIINAFEVEIDF